MGILDNLKSLVIEEVEIKETTISPKPIILPTSSPITFNQQYQASQDEIVTLDKSFRIKLKEAITLKSPQFFSKLNDLLTTLAEDIPNEQARYKTALKLLAKDGASPASIISDLDICISAINDKNKEFSTALNKKIEEQIGGRKQKIISLEQEIQSKNQQIQMLQADIEKAKSQHDLENSSITEESAKFDLRKNRFDIVCTDLVNQLNNQKQKISEFTK